MLVDLLFQSVDGMVALDHLLRQILVAILQRPGGQQGISDLLQLLDPCPQCPLPGPGRAVALHDRGEGITHQHWIGQ